MKNKLTLLLTILGFISFSSLKAGSDTSKCVWAQNVGFAVWDTCQGNSGKNSLNGSISVKGSCLKYTWTVNGVLKSTGNSLNYPLSANGSYLICVKVTDTCSRCDTTLCMTRNISCFGSKCSWMPMNVGFSFWDTCQGNSGRNSLNGNISVKGSCLKYAWTVNGVLRSTGYNLHHPVTANGSYLVCVKVTDTCNKCDTTICSTRTINCFGSKCNWGPQNASFAVWDTCQGNSGRNSLNGNISVKGSCLKYAWSVNGVFKSDHYSFHYPVTANGTYLLCLKVTDTCNKCDTTFCSTRTISCFNSKCNWAQNASFGVWDSCKGGGGMNFIYGSISVKGACLKYAWTVNGVAKGNSYSLQYPIFTNGSYLVCVKVTDTCHKCDTTFCSTRQISCFGGSSKCNWGPQNVGFAVWDTCKGSSGRSSLNGSISAKGSCLKYAWTVNGVLKGSSNMLHYPITANGTYLICVKVTDTCKKCDTTFCSTRHISCFGSKCNWGPQNVGFSTWDSCQGNGGITSINGNISVKGSCLKYAWSVNGVVKGNSYNIHYPITANGMYALCVKVTDTCNKCDTTFCRTFNINCKLLSTDHITSAEQLKLYPNPANDMLSLDWSGSDCKYVITSAMGAIVQDGMVTNGNNLVRIATLPEGLYFVQLQTDAGLLTRKLVIRR